VKPEDTNLTASDETETETESDTSNIAQCSGRPDFTACNVVTVPDRSYDICVAETCVSPGCGDASCNVPGPHFPLADTNQRLCYDDSGPTTCSSLPCNADGSPDFCGQDAQYGWDVTHNEATRFTRTAPVADQPIVQDNVTGLVWQSCPAGLTGDDCMSGGLGNYNWLHALVYCENLDWGGHTDWRLPDQYELFSILDHSMTLPAIAPAVFPKTPNDWFWSSSSDVEESKYKWAVFFDNGGTASLGLSGSRDGRIRCVRKGPFQSRRLESLILLNDLVVLDRVNNLEWQGCAAGLSDADCASGWKESYTWQQALVYCEGLSYGGNADWRLPNLTELQSIVDTRRFLPALDLVIFPAISEEFFWSSSSLAQDSTCAWGIWLKDGSVLYSDKDSRYGTVRCVRASTGS
jgi:hypothetical protein